MRSSLESKALSGGVALVMRQFVGIVLSIVGMLVNTRLLGPHKYGQFAIVVGLMGFATSVGKLGLDVHLIRYQGDLDQKQIGVTQTLYLAIGVVVFVTGIIMGPLAASWYKDPFFKHLLWAYTVVPPLTLMNGVSVALLDRGLEYKKAVKVELSGQVTYLAVSMLIIWYTRSVWGLVLGSICQAALCLVMAKRLSGMKFRPAWDREVAKAQLHYGFGFAASGWIWQAKGLVNPLVIGRLLGTEAVAFVAMAANLAQMVGFANGAVWRVYMSLLARLAKEKEKMKKTLEDGLNHTVIILVASYISFMAVAPEIIKGFMGARWLPVLTVFPFIAAGQIVAGGFSLHSSALYVTGRNNDVSIFHLVYMALFMPAAWYLTTILGNITGYGWAEVVAFPSFLWIRDALGKRLFVIRERPLFFNMAYALAGMTLMAAILGSVLWVRLLSGYLVLVVFMLAVPMNRETGTQFMCEVTKKFRLRSA